MKLQQIPNKVMKINLIILFLLAMSLSMTGEDQEYQPTVGILQVTHQDKSIQLEQQRQHNQKKLQELEKTLISNYELVRKDKK